MVIAGQFTMVNNVSRPYIARLTSYGSVDSSFVPATIDGYLITSVTQPDGRIIAGGDFTAAGSANIVRFNTDGTMDFSFNASAPPMSNLVLQDDGRIIAGGGYGPYLMRVYGDIYPPEFTAQPTNRAATVGTSLTFRGFSQEFNPHFFPVAQEWHRHSLVGRLELLTPSTMPR